MALGEDDDYTGVKPCRGLADDFARAGGKITVKIYPGATHGRDGNPDATRMIRVPLVENPTRSVSSTARSANDRCGPRWRVRKR